MLGQLETPYSAPYSGSCRNDRYQQVGGLRRWHSTPRRNHLGMSTTQLSPGGQLAIGAACCLLGVGLLAVSATLFLQDSASGWSSDAIPGAAAGGVFAFSGAAMLTPPGRGRLRLVLAALLVTSWALAGDWIAFGPGVRQFTTSISQSGSVSSPVDPWEGRIIFGIVAVLLDLFAGGLWYVLMRRWRC